jgi:uncharacterized protein
MRILITGGTGFIGTRLCQYLARAGHHLTVYSRRPFTVRLRCGAEVEPLVSLDEPSSEREFDAVINLAGEAIAGKRWSRKRKELLLNSRLLTTQNVLDMIGRMSKPPSCLINASAVGFYGDQGDTDVDETTAPADGFGHQLCHQWEQLATQAEALNVRVCIVRIGLVVGRDGGFLEKMLPPFKLGVGGHFGSGQQWMSWVHRDDLVRMIVWLLEHQECSGAYNATAPYPVRNKDFTNILAKKLKRPALLPMPSFVANALFGEMAGLFLTGQRVLPRRITETGFEFNYPDLKAALAEVLP